MENVANLEKHNSGKTLTVMLSVLSDLGYTVNYKVLNAKDFGVPQNRDRIIMVGSLDGIVFDFSKLKTDTVCSMKSFLDRKGNFDILERNSYTLLDKSLK